MAVDQFSITAQFAKYSHPQSTSQAYINVRVLIYYPFYNNNLYGQMLHINTFMIADIVKFFRKGCLFSIVERSLQCQM